MQLETSGNPYLVATQDRVIGRRSSACVRCRHDLKGLATTFAHRCRSISGYSDVDRKDMMQMPDMAI
jgi:hypothetical protein